MAAISNIYLKRKNKIEKKTINDHIIISNLLIFSQKCVYCNITIVKIATLNLPERYLFSVSIICASRADNFDRHSPAIILYIKQKGL
jgi:hypothetical protein